METKEFTMAFNNFDIIMMTEWGSKISNTTCIRRFGALWMVNMVDKFTVTSKLEDFISKFNES